jgi:parvulin-like peptidyl-prolyl isomerase
VSLTVKDGSGFTYRNAMSVVRREIKLSDADIAEIRPRKVVMGSLIFEIAGQDAGSKASRLVERMACAFQDFPAKVAMPRRTTELKVTELENSVTPEKVVAAVAEAGGCRAEEVNVGVIRPLLRASARYGYAAR